MRLALDAYTLEALLARVYRHFPRGIGYDDRRHIASEQSRRRACVLEAAAIACGKGFVPVPETERVPVDPEVQPVIDALRAWRQFGQRCRETFPDRVVWDASGPFFDPGYRYSIAQAGYVPPPRIPVPGQPADEPARSYLDATDEYDPVVCVVSALAPVYAIITFVPEPDGDSRVRYGDFPERYHDRTGTLSVLAEEVFGFAGLDAATVLTPVPDVQPHTAHRPMTETTLGDCLFTTFY